jgi:hypothetical protein
MCKNIKPFIQFLTNSEALLVYLLVALIFINIVYFSNYPIKLLGLNLLVIIIYFLLSTNKQKWIMFIAAINFAIWGTLLEALLIKTSHFALKYRKPITGMFVPSWLISVYIVFAIGAIFTFDAFKVLLN